MTLSRTTPGEEYLGPPCRSLDYPRKHAIMSLTMAVVVLHKHATPSFTFKETCAGDLTSGTWSTFLTIVHFRHACMEWRKKCPMLALLRSHHGELPALHRSNDPPPNLITRPLANPTLSDDSADVSITFLYTFSKASISSHVNSFDAERGFHLEGQNGG